MFSALWGRMGPPLMSLPAFLSLLPCCWFLGEVDGTCQSEGGRSLGRGETQTYGLPAGAAT